MSTSTSKKRAVTGEASQGKAKKAKKSTEDEDPTEGGILVKDLDKLSFLHFNVARVKMAVAEKYQAAAADALRLEAERRETETLLETKRRETETLLETKRRETETLLEVLRRETEIQLEIEKRTTEIEKIAHETKLLETRIAFNESDMKKETFMARMGGGGYMQPGYGGYMLPHGYGGMPGHGMMVGHSGTGGMPGGMGGMPGGTASSGMGGPWPTGNNAEM